MAPRMLAPVNARNPDIVEHVRAIMAFTPVNGYVGDVLGLAARPDSTPTLAHITCPTLIVVGEEDALAPPADSQMMAQMIEGAQLVIIPNAGHLSPIEQPEAFSTAVADFARALSN